MSFNPNAVSPIAPTMQHSSMNMGAVAIEQSRAITEAQGKLLLAKQFPRDENAVYTKLMASCARRGLASAAIYSFPRGRETVSGPSIRLAEEIARLYGNIEFGIRELSNHNGESEMEAYAWDLETNVVSSQKFKVRHERSTKSGTYALNDQRDVYELTANLGARRLRSRLLAVLPPYLVEAATEECRKTLAGNQQEPIEDRARKMLAVFAKMSISQEMIEKRLGYTIDKITVDDIIDLMGIHNSLKNGQSGRDDWFEVTKVEPEKVELTATQNFNPAKIAKPEQQKEPEPVQASADPSEPETIENF